MLAYYKEMNFFLLKYSSPKGACYLCEESWVPELMIGTPFGQDTIRHGWTMSLGAPPLHGTVPFYSALCFLQSPHHRQEVKFPQSINDLKGQESVVWLSWGCWGSDQGKPLAGIRELGRSGFHFPGSLERREAGVSDIPQLGGERV